MLALLTAIAVRAMLRTCRRFTSMPTVNMNRHTPTWLSRRSVPSESGGNTAANRSGASRPNSDGPSTTPAAISPTTPGCPNRMNSRLISREATRMTNSCRNRRASGLWKLARNSAVNPASPGTAVAVAAVDALTAGGPGSDEPSCNTPTMPAPATSISRT